jgi:hypothetical protein
MRSGLSQAASSRRRPHPRRPRDRLGFWPTFVRRLAILDLDPPLPNPEWVRWDATPEGEAAVAVPAWIDDAIRRVQAKLAGCDLQPVLGHADWEAQNIRWRHGEPHVVHDWDGLVKHRVVSNLRPVSPSRSGPRVAWSEQRAPRS